MVKTQVEGVVTIRDDDGKMIGFIYHDSAIKRPVIYGCEPLGVDQVAEIISGRKLDLINNHHEQEMPPLRGGDNLS
jgi:hypothetical protein